MAEEVPVPPQWQPQPAYDFRHGADGPRGYKVSINKNGVLGTKRKLDAYSEQVEREQAEAAMRDGEDEPALGQLKRPKMNTVGVGKSSGRGSWKQPAQRANSVKNSTLSSTWEKKMKIKAERDSYQSRKKEVAEVRREAAKEEKARRSEVRRKKEENRAKSVVTTKISAATARRMAKNKKLKKKLVMVDG